MFPLRSISGIPVFALTGTADKQALGLISTCLALKDGTLTLFISPNKKNLRINVIKTTKAEDISKLNWLTELIAERAENMPKTILFCNTVKDITTIVNHWFFNCEDDVKDFVRATGCLLGG